MMRDALFRRGFLGDDRSDSGEHEQRGEQWHQDFANGRSRILTNAEAVVRNSPAQIKVHTPPSENLVKRDPARVWNAEA